MKNTNKPRPTFDPTPVATWAKEHEAQFALEERRAARLAAMRRHPSNPNWKPAR